jgi:hypothetical protein
LNFIRTCARILSRFTTSTNEAAIQNEWLAQTSLSQAVLAFGERYDWDLDLLENCLVFALLSKNVFAPI